MPFPLTIVLLFLSGCLYSQADTVYRAPEPRTEVRNIALHYINQDWTEAQWDSLSGSIVELTLFVDEIGEPYLESARGFESPAVFDRLVTATTDLMYFEPARQNGKYVGGRYTLWVIFPVAGSGPFDHSALYTPSPYITQDTLAANYRLVSNTMFFDFNLSYNVFTGDPGAYLKNGFGMDLAAGGRWSDHWGAGLSMGFEGNDRRQPFPEDPYPDRDELSGGVYIGGLIDYSLILSRRGYLSARTEVGYAALNAANRLDPGEKDGWVQYRGVHTGLALQYSFRVGRPGIFAVFDAAKAVTNYSAVNAVAGVRYRYYGDRVGTGAYYFLGLGYRLGGDTYRRIRR